MYIYKYVYTYIYMYIYRHRKEMLCGNVTVTQNDSCLVLHCTTYNTFKSLIPKRNTQGTRSPRMSHVSFYVVQHKTRSNPCYQREMLKAFSVAKSRSPTREVGRLVQGVRSLSQNSSIREVGGWGRDPKKCTGRDWGMGSSTI